MTDATQARIIRTWEPVTVTIAGRPTTLKIKRQTLKEFSNFDRLFARAMNAESDRLVMVRRPGDEMERRERVVLSAQRVSDYQSALDIIETLATEPTTDRMKELITLARTILAEVQPNEHFVIEDDEIKRRRILELTDQERANYERLKQADNESFEQAAMEGLSKYVRVVPGQISIEDDETGEITDVTTGEQLQRALSTSWELIQILLAIKRANTVTDQEKNESGSPSTSKTSSSERDPKATGESPVVAGSAGPLGSATTGDATPSATTPSGSTVM